MEEKNNMTAERSLAIITEQIERSRRAVSKSTGQSLYISGLCTMAMAIIVPIVNLLILPDDYATLGHLLWFTLPFIILFIIRNLYKNREHAPVSLVGTLVGKTWKTFGVFGLGFFILANGWNYILSNSTNDTMAIVAHHANLTPVIYLLMGMAVAITGHILNSRWLVWFGIIASLVIAVCDFACVGTMLLARFGAPLSIVAHSNNILPCVSVFVLAFFGLMLPGLLLKNQK